MAAATVGSELAIVDVVGTMTVGAVLAQTRLRSERLAMAAFARDVRVRAVERETRLRVVVELPLLPVDRVMAKEAVLAKPPLVRVIVAVATDAVIRGILEYMRVVTLATLRLCVLA